METAATESPPAGRELSAPPREGSGKDRATEPSPAPAGRRPSAGPQGPDLGGGARLNLGGGAARRGGAAATSHAPTPAFGKVRVMLLPLFEI